jgi:serine protease Do
LEVGAKIVKTSIKKQLKLFKSGTTKIIKKANYFIVIFAFIAGLGGGIVAQRVFPTRETSLDKTSDQQKIVSSESQLISSIAFKVSPSVVSINVTGQSTSSLQLFFGGSGVETASAGTGIILSSDGIVMTNKHVIPDGTSSVSVTTSDGKKYDNVQVLARDPRSNYDVAFLKISGVNNLTPAILGNSSKMQVGDQVIAIGYALGEFQNTVTNGIISGLGRPVTAGDTSGSSSESLTNLFQTDAAINPGNSGGPLLNINGEVIGMNTAVASNAQNIGFAIPVNDIKTQIASILSKGKLEVAYLGVRYIVLTKEIQTRYDLSNGQGAWLMSTTAQNAVINDSPADKAGLRQGDIVTKINDEELTSDNVLATILSKYNIGDKIYITYVRDGQTKTTDATLEVAPASN